MKFSEEIGKVTLPGAKSVLRIFSDNGKPLFDLLTLDHEVDSILENIGNPLKYYNKKALDQTAFEIVPARIELKTVKLIKDGKRCAPSEKMSIRRDTQMANINLFGGLDGLIEGDEKYNVHYSQGVYDLFCKKY